MNQAKITKITIGRLYNLGNYEHIRYELTVEVPEGASATQAVLGTERLLAGLEPIKHIKTELQLSRDAATIERMKGMSAEKWDEEFSHYTGTREEIIQRYESALAEETRKRNAAVTKAQTCRKLFDDLGGASEYKDAKMDWEDDDY